MQHSGGRGAPADATGSRSPGASRTPDAALACQPKTSPHPATRYPSAV